VKGGEILLREDANNFFEDEITENDLAQAL
jgi:hypothetical protein